MPSPTRSPTPGASPSLWHRLMTGVLGYPRYGAHGGDIGAVVTNRLGLEHPDVAGIQVTMPAEPLADPASLTAEEREFLAGRPVARRPVAPTRTCNGPGR